MNKENFKIELYDTEEMEEIFQTEKARTENSKIHKIQKINCFVFIASLICGLIVSLFESSVYYLFCFAMSIICLILSIIAEKVTSSNWDLLALEEVLKLINVVKNHPNDLTIKTENNEISDLYYFDENKVLVNTNIHFQTIPINIRYYKADYVLIRGDLDKENCCYFITTYFPMSYFN